MDSQQSNRRQGRNARRGGRGAAARQSRLGRTIILGTFAVAVALFWLARELELDPDELLGYLATSALFVGMLIGLSVVGGAVVWLIRRLRGKRRSG